MDKVWTQSVKNSVSQVHAYQSAIIRKALNSVHDPARDITQSLTSYCSAGSMGT